MKPETNKEAGSHAPPKAASSPAAVWRTVSVLLFVCLLLALGLLYYGSQYKQDKQAERITAAMGLLSDSRQELVHLQAEFDALRSQFLIEESTRKGLETKLLQSQDELVRAQEQLAFYAQLMPAGAGGALALRALDITQSDGLLHYRVLLQRNGVSEQPFEGRMEFEAQGVREGKSQLVVLQSAQAEQAETSDTLNLSFERFSRVDGWLGIPSDFVPQSVTLKVFEGNVLRITRKVELERVDATQAP